MRSCLEASGASPNSAYTPGEGSIDRRAGAKLKRHFDKYHYL
ncbi:MAG: hypothetical protein ACTSRA_19270 [Promethearchaeota archaeon]